MAMQQVTTWLLDAIRARGPLAVVMGVLIESVIVPIPSPVIIMGAGSILIAPDLPWPRALIDILRLIVLPGALASTIGAWLGYGIGYWGGKPLIERCRRFLGFGWEDVLRMEQRLSKRHPGPMIALLRALPIIPLSLISIAGGVIRWPLGSFSLWTFVGSVPRCLVLAILGWMTRGAYDGLAHGFDRLESLVSAGIVVAVVALVWWLRNRIQRS